MDNAYWTREERDSWRATPETLVITLRAEQWRRILATVDALEKALALEHANRTGRHSCGESGCTCALLAALRGKP